MPTLIDPTPELRDSFLDAIAEFLADDDFPLSWFVGDIEPRVLTDRRAFDGYVRRVLGERNEGGIAEGFVPMTTLWWVDGDRWIGRLAIRHRLTPVLERVGGHIGYDVRPSARRRGHATSMLAAALPVARSLGIDEALLTCDEWNVASQRVIEANGGRLHDSLDGRRRYQVPTTAGC